MKTALITGSTSGIGYEFAQIFGRFYYRLVLVGRDREKLRKVQHELHEKHNIEVVIIPKDLSKQDAADEIYELLKKENIEVDVLINNAGFGTYGNFHELDIEKEIEMINVNIVALTKLTHLFLKDMIKNNSGKILNVASTAGFQPGPLMAVYYATKAYALSFSEAIAEELSGTNITVTALCPGPTQTGFQKSANIEESRLVKGRKIATAKDVAEFGYKAMMNKKRVAIHGSRNRTLAFAVRFTPRKTITRIVRKMNEKR